MQGQITDLGGGVATELLKRRIVERAEERQRAEHDTGAMAAVHAGGPEADNAGQPECAQLTHPNRMKPGPRPRKSYRL